APNPGSPLSVADMSQSVYFNGVDYPMTIVRGYVVNQSESVLRNIRVRGQLTRDGEVVATLEAPAGRRLNQDELDTITEPAQLNVLYEQVASEASDTLLRNNQSMPFSLVFLGEHPSGPNDQLTYDVELAGAEIQTRQIIWRNLTFTEAGVQASP
ncbi:MAG: hypothetical protein KC561_18905, partial [Myxococcales bacterium]|nr:hypothetical protein [Myxococcales bacterium]